MDFSADEGQCWVSGGSRRACPRRALCRSAWSWGPSWRFSLRLFYSASEGPHTLNQCELPPLTLRLGRTYQVGAGGTLQTMEFTLLKVDAGRLQVTTNDLAESVPAVRAVCGQPGRR